MGRFVFFTYFDGVIYKRKSLIRILQTLIGYAYVIFIEMRDVLCCVKKDCICTYAFYGDVLQLY